jgi:hypothetical protein
MEIARRLTRIFVRDENGRRPVYRETRKFQADPHWRDYILFYEYFHGDNGAGLGASHQTGWTGLAASWSRWCTSLTLRSCLRKLPATMKVYERQGQSGSAQSLL